MKKHPLDPLSLVIGLVFAAFGTAFLVTQVDIANADTKWIWPVALLGLGAIMIALGARRTGQTNQPEIAPADSDPSVPG
jgi:uncharacterized membrane protein